MKPSEIVKELSNMAIAYAALEVCSPTKIEALAAAANLIKSLIPKPIEDAPKDDFNYCLALSGNITDQCFFSHPNSLDKSINTHFIPLASIQKLMEGQDNG